jgi:hypothetical protein
MTRQNAQRIGIFIVAIIGLLILGSIFSQHTYFLERVDPQEVAVRFRGGTIYEVAGPGVYSDIALYADIKRVSSEGVSFTVEDPEVITLDRQRVGLRVSGDAFRPGIMQAQELRELWPSYQGLYLSDDRLRTRVIDLALQAMKSCVGDRSFNDNVIGTSRDELRTCVDDRLSLLATPLGLEIKNVAVPNIILSQEVQASLDSITKSRLDTELAQQDAIKAREQALADQSREEGVVRVVLARQQEEVRQKTILSQLERARLEADRIVIEQQKSNDLFAAQKELEISLVESEVALLTAQATLAEELVLAKLYGENGQYAYLQALFANASALREIDKIIFTQEGTTPTIVVPGPGIMPVVETAPSGVVSPPQSQEPTAP